jgi:hypothetical protein
MVCYPLHKTEFFRFDGSKGVEVGVEETLQE